jgi:C4-dicarboxylate-specific signal transduction histidine kinase
MKQDDPCSTSQFGLPPQQFATAFPFHLVLNMQMEILQVGSTLQRICADILPSVSMDKLFESILPEGVFCVDWVLENAGSFFLLKHRASDLKLRGEFVFLPSEKVLLFLGTPWFIDASEIAIHKLSFADFATHDAVVDMLQLFQVNKMALEDANKLSGKLTAQRGVLRLANENLKKQEEKMQQLTSELLRSRDEMAEVVDTIIQLEEGIAFLDRDDRFVFTNPEYLRMHEKVIDSVQIGVLFEDHLRILFDAGEIITHIIDCEEWITKRMVAHRSLPSEFEIVIAGGKTLNIREHLTHSGGTAMVIREISEQKKLQAQLVHSSKLASLGNMATGVAHELNQPLNIISLAAGNVERTLKRGEFGPEYQLEKMQRIKDNVIRASKIIGHLRSFGRDANEAAQPFDPLDAVRGAIGMIGEQLRLSSIELVLALPIEAGAKVFGYALRFEQVLLSLIRNASDELIGHPSGLAPKRIQIAVVFEPQGQVSISVEDNGPGVPVEILENIFDPFFTTKKVGKGTGLGLSVSYGIINDMGGKIIVVNTSGGARFDISLPTIHHGSNTD